MTRREFLTLLSSIGFASCSSAGGRLTAAMAQDFGRTPEAIDKTIDERLAHDVDYAAVMLAEPSTLSRFSAPEQKAFLEKLRDPQLVPYLNQWRRKGLLRLKSAKIAPAAKALLLELQLENVLHEVATCLDHFIGVHDILREWGHPEEVALVGLFHAVYGTEPNKVTVLDPRSSKARAKVRSIVGKDSEHWTYLFGRAETADFILQVHETARPVTQMRDFASCDKVALSHRDFVTVSEALVANSLEPYRATSEKSFLSRLRQFEVLRPYLSKGGRATLDLKQGPPFDFSELAPFRTCG